MSGPIVRKYGFPNFEKIFGERALEHGVDEDKKSEPAAQPEKEPAGSQPPTGSASQASAPKQRTK